MSPAPRGGLVSSRALPGTAPTLNTSQGLTLPRFGTRRPFLLSQTPGSFHGPSQSWGPKGLHWRVGWDGEDPLGRGHVSWLGGRALEQGVGAQESGTK